MTWLDGHGWGRGVFVDVSDTSCPVDDNPCTRTFFSLFTPKPCLRKAWGSWGVVGVDAVPGPALAHLGTQGGMA